MNGTIDMGDMGLFARVAEAKSFTAAAQALGIPKQTLSRRIAALERALGVRLMHRTTRRLHLTDAGAAYAEGCAELVRVAAAANRAVTDAHEAPAGTLRVTADPVLGEAFLAELLVDYARRHPAVRLHVLLTRRRVDLVAEGFDVAFRVGPLDDPAAGVELGPARIRYCASPQYVARRGAPTGPEQLAEHDCLVVASPGEAVRWPLPGERRPRLVPVVGKHVLSSFALARSAALAGLGIAIFPEFACVDDVRRGRLVPVLGPDPVDVGAVCLVHAGGRRVPARVRAFTELARERFARQPPWVVRPPARRRAAAGTRR